MRCVCNIDGRGVGTLCAAHQNGVDAAVKAERQRVADAMAHMCVAATKSGDTDKAARFADAQALIAEAFPDDVKL